MDGSLILPDSPDYEQAHTLFNTRFDSVRPRAIARCAHAGDVAEVLSFVRRHHLDVTPRSGGHSYAGYSTGAGVVIDVRRMNSIVLSGDTATIGAGAKLVDVYDQLTASGVSIPSGSCPSIGIAGITQGGGIGVVDRAYGLTCDRLLSAQVVTADGRHLTCDTTHDPELFWALRGGGGGNFGIATSLTFRTHPTRDLVKCNAGFRFEDAANVLAAWQAWPQTLPDTIWSSAVFWFNNDPPNSVFFYVSAVCVGSQSDLEFHWNRFLGATGAQPLTSRANVVSYREAMLGDCDGLSVSQCHLPGETSDAAMARTAMAASSDFFDAALPDAGIQTLLQAVRNRLASGKRGAILLDLMGGAIAAVAPDATAFVHRNALFSAQYLAFFSAGTAADVVDEGGIWANSMRAVIRPWSSGRAYQNYIDPRIENWGAAYYGSNYERLVRVKAQYDPDWVFRFAHGVPPR